MRDYCDRTTKAVFTAGPILSAVQWYTVHERGGCEGRLNNWASSTHWLRGIFAVALICMYSCADNASDRQTDSRWTAIATCSRYQPADIDCLPEELLHTGPNSVLLLSPPPCTLVSHMRVAPMIFCRGFRAGL